MYTVHAHTHTHTCSCRRQCKVLTIDNAIRSPCVVGGGVHVEDAGLKLQRPPPHTTVGLCQSFLQAPVTQHVSGREAVDDRALQCYRVQRGVLSLVGCLTHKAGERDTSAAVPTLLGHHDLIDTPCTCRGWTLCRCGITNKPRPPPVQQRCHTHSSLCHLCPTSYKCMTKQTQGMEAPTHHLTPHLYTTPTPPLPFLSPPLPSPPLPSTHLLVLIGPHWL